MGSAIFTIGFAGRVKIPQKVLNWLLEILKKVRLLTSELTLGFCMIYGLLMFTGSKNKTKNPLTKAGTLHLQQLLPYAMKEVLYFTVGHTCDCQV